MRAAIGLLATSLLAHGSGLDRERNADRLEAASVAIAASTNATEMADLARHIGQRQYLQRLDPDNGVTRLGHIFRVLAEHPSPSTESLCIEVAGSSEFNELPARMNFLLNALASVRPMSEPAARIFRSYGRSGFLEVEGPLLATNASPRALDVLAEFFKDDSLDVAQRVSMAHWGILPNRTNSDVIEMCDRVLRAGVSRMWKSQSSKVCTTISLGSGSRSGRGSRRRRDGTPHLKQPRISCDLWPQAEWVAPICRRRFARRWKDH